jgi:hypothetical protein
VVSLARSWMGTELCRVRGRRLEFDRPGCLGGSRRREGSRRVAMIPGRRLSNCRGLPQLRRSPTVASASLASWPPFTAALATTVPIGSNLSEGRKSLRSTGLQDDRDEPPTVSQNSFRDDSRDRLRVGSNLSRHILLKKMYFHSSSQCLTSGDTSEARLRHLRANHATRSDSPLAALAQNDRGTRSIRAPPLTSATCRPTRSRPRRGSCCRRRGS